jgi:hypothetical protein
MPNLSFIALKLGNYLNVILRCYNYKYLPLTAAKQGSNCLHYNCFFNGGLAFFRKIPSSLAFSHYHYNQYDDSNWLQTLKTCHPQIKR